MAGNPQPPTATELAIPKSGPSGYRTLAINRPPRPTKIRKEWPQDVDKIRTGLRETLNNLATGRAPWPLLMIGETGRGKSTAAVCFANAVMGSHYVTLQHVVDVCYEPLTHFFWREQVVAPLLVVDELGLLDEITYREMRTAEQLADLRQWLPTIWITNRTPDWLITHYGARVHSRLTRGTVVEVGGPDQRHHDKER